jgi:outer membrane protein OmpA-like peptidoglycan-associated protein
MILEEVSNILKKRNDVSHIYVVGHTDNHSSRAFNMKLSMDRANAVRDWLIDYGGIDENRLSAKGFGPDKPIDNNDTAAGRQNNRRVEFHTYLDD